jgi:hypothetical protein
VDFDSVTLEDTIPQLEKAINLDCLHILKTRGGFHVLVEFAKMDKKYEKSWYNKISKIEGADITNADLQPVCGTFQGMFIPHFIKIS